MKTSAVIACVLGFVGRLFAQEDTPPTGELGIAVVNFTFHGGPAQYSLTFPADSNLHYTNNDLSVNAIHVGDFPVAQCTFYTPHEKTLLRQYYPDGIRVLVGPPQPITAVSCFGGCVANYADCRPNGTYIGDCCNGYCSDGICWPWSNIA